MTRWILLVVGCQWLCREAAGPRRTETARKAKAMRSWVMTVRFALIVVLASLLLAGHEVRPAYGVAYAVNSLADNMTADGRCTLREAILAANNAPANGDCGLGSPGDDTITFSVSGTIVLGSTLPAIAAGVGALTIDSGGVITISGNNAVGVMVVNSGATLTLKNLIITNGRAYSGGGIYNSGMLNVTSSTFSGNSGGAGGGIYNSGMLNVTSSTFSGNSGGTGGGGICNSGTLTVTNSTFSGNSADYGYGGGIYNRGTLNVINSTFSGNSAGDNGGGIDNSGTLNVTSSTFSGNSADYGGGIYNSGMLNVTDSTFSGNSASYYNAAGGGIYNYYGTLNVTSSTFSGNSADYGGGIYNSGTLTVTNSTFSGNSATYYTGGGIHNRGTLTVTNSTFSGNSARYFGGGVYNNDYYGTATLKNTIIANSTGGDCVGTLRGTNINNLIENSVNACGLTNGVNGNIIGIDPNLGSLTGSPAYFPLLLGSPAIDAGDNATCATPPVSNQSQNGVIRPQDGNGDGVAVCDIGSYEAPGGSSPAPQVETREPQISSDDPLHKVVLQGVVTTTTSTTVWFEWGTDPNLSTYQSTAAITVTGTSVGITTALQLPPTDSIGRPFYYRIAAGNPSNPHRGRIQRILILLGNPNDRFPSGIRKPPYWNKYDRLIHYYAHQAGWPAPVVKAILAHESHWDFYDYEDGHFNNYPERNFLYEPVAVDWWQVYQATSTPQVTLTQYLLPNNPPSEWPYNRHWNTMVEIPGSAKNLDMVGRCSFTLTITTNPQEEPYHSACCGRWREAMSRTNWTRSFITETYRMLYGITNPAITSTTASQIMSLTAQYRLASSYGLGQVVYISHHDRVQRILGHSSPPPPETLYNPELNIRVAVNYLEWLKARPVCQGAGIQEQRWDNRQDWEKAVRGYNDGKCNMAGYKQGNAFSHILGLLKASSPVLAPPDFDANNILAPTTANLKAAGTRLLASPGEFEVDQLIADIKGLGQAQLMVLSVVTTDPDEGVDYGQLTIFADTSGNTVEWESPPLKGVLINGVVLTQTLPEGGPPLIATLWGAGAHGTRAYLFRWDGQTFRALQRVDSDGTLAMDFFGDAGVDLGKGSIVTVSRDGENPLSIFHADAYAWDAASQTFVWTGEETITNEERIFRIYLPLVLRNR